MLGGVKLGRSVQGHKFAIASVTYPPLGRHTVAQLSSSAVCWLRQVSPVVCAKGFTSRIPARLSSNDEVAGSDCRLTRVTLQTSSLGF